MGQVLSWYKVLQCRWAITTLKRKRPARLLNEGGTNACDENVKTFYCCIDFDAVDTGVQCREDRLIKLR